MGRSLLSIYLLYEYFLSSLNDLYYIQSPMLQKNGFVAAADLDLKLSPFYQNLPDCSQPKDLNFIKKKTTAKAILCPMIR